MFLDPARGRLPHYENHMINKIFISEFIEKHCPMEINVETFNSITLSEPPLNARQSTVRQYCSERYQRRFGSWTTKQKCAYISNIFLGRIYNPIHVMKVTPQDRNIDNLPMNIGFACLDGQHRSRTIAEFVNNDFGFTGTIKSQKYNNVQFSKMPPSVQNYFMRKCKVILCHIDHEDSNAAQAFIDINDGCPLNDQEKRNALNTPISGWVRKQSEDFKDVFKQIVGVKYERMEDCALITRMAIMITGLKENKETANDRSALNKFYNSGINDPDYYNDDVLSYISKELLPSLRLVARDHKSNYNSKMRTRAIFGFMVIHMFLSESNREHNIRAEFLFDYCKDLIGKLDSSSQSKMLKDEERLGRNNLQPSDYFHEYTNSVMTSAKFDSFVSGLLNSFDEDFEKLIDEIETLQSERESVAAK